MTDRSSLAQCVESLAEDIARAAPDFAEKAMKIVELARELQLEPDRTSIQDAIEATTLDSDLPDSKVQVTTSAVLAALKA